MSLEKRVWIRYKDQAEMIKAKAKCSKYKLSHTDIYRLGLESLDNKANISGVQLENAYLEAYLYYKEARDKKLYPWKIVLDKGRKVNVDLIRIYRIDELLDGDVVITFNTDKSKEIKMMKKVRGNVEPEILEKFLLRT